MGAGQGYTRDQHVAVATAAAVAFDQLRATPGRFQSAEELSAKLNQAALALASLVPIFIEEGGKVRQLTPGELEGCRFERGATRVVCRDGTRYGRPTVKRGDLWTAIALLRARRDA